MDSPKGIVITIVVFIVVILSYIGREIWRLEKEKRRQRPS